MWHQGCTYVPRSRALGVCVSVCALAEHACLITELMQACLYTRSREDRLRMFKISLHGLTACYEACSVRVHVSSSH